MLCVRGFELYSRWVPLISLLILRKKTECFAVYFPVGLIAYNGSYTALHMSPIEFKEISYCEIYTLPESIRNV